MIRSLRLKFACDEDWESFAGEAGVRRCDRCATSVHDLSTLTRAEATALFRAPPKAGLCVRYQHDGMGRILFRSERVPGQLVWQRFVPPAREAGAGEPVFQSIGSADVVAGDTARRSADAAERP